MLTIPFYAWLARVRVPPRALTTIQRKGFGMELTEDAVTRLLAALAAEKNDGTAENVLMVAERMDDGPVRRELLVAVADGLGVDLV